jgi:uncharacterized protein (TIGR02147 family)
MPDLFTYDDYRRYLKDFYQARKSHDPKFSHRYLAGKIGYGSSGAIADILAGRKNLASAAALRLARALGLGRDEEEFFLHLVSFNQSGTLEEKNLHYAKILSMKRLNLNLIAPEKLEYFSKWYHAALRELLYFHPCKDDFKSLGKKLSPAVPEKDVKKALLLMEKLGMVVRDDRGYFRQSAKLISTPDFGGSLLVDNFQMAMMKLAVEALDRHPRERRDFSTLTVTLSEKSLDAVKTAMKALRQCILGLAEKDEAVDRVYQVNMQMFPLTEYEGEKNAQR